MHKSCPYIHYRVVKMWTTQTHTHTHTRARAQIPLKSQSWQDFSGWGAGGVVNKADSDRETDAAIHRSLTPHTDTHRSGRWTWVRLRLHCVFFNLLPRCSLTCCSNWDKSERGADKWQEQPPPTHPRPPSPLEVTTVHIRSILVRLCIYDLLMFLNCHSKKKAETFHSAEEFHMIQRAG